MNGEEMRNMIKSAQISQGHIPFLRFLLACIMGVGLAVWMEPDPNIHIMLEGCCIILVAAGLIGMIIPADKSPPHFISILFMLLLILYCWKKTWDPDPRIDARHFSRHQTDFLLGFVAEEPRMGERHVRCVLRITGGMDSLGSTSPFIFRGMVQVTIEIDSNQQRTPSTARHPLVYGSRVLIPAVHRSVPPPANPGEMDYAAHLAKNNCWHQIYIRASEVRLLDGWEGSRLRAYAFGLRERMVAKFGRYIPNADARAIASTLILGYRAELSRELMEMYSSTGTIHVLSVSGMHVVIVFWLLAKLLFWMNLHPWLIRLRFPILLVAIWGYALLTGFSPSVMRAAMMLSFVLWAKATDRVQRTYNNIGASAFILILYNPKLMMNIGFQLSYLAVLGIVSLYPLLKPAFRPRLRWLQPIGDYSAMSVGAQVGAFPLAMYYFQQFPVYFLLANLVIVLPASAIMYLGFALLLLPETAAMEAPLIWSGQLLSGLIVSVNTILSRIQGLPAASLSGLETALWQCGLIYLIIISLAWGFITRSGRHFIAALSLLAILTGAGMLRSWRKWEQRRIVIHQMRSSMAISIAGRGEAVLYTDLPSLEFGALPFSVMPYLKTVATGEAIGFVQVGDAFQNGRIYIDGGLIQVGERRLFVYEGRAPPPGTGLLEVDVLLIRGNPRTSLVEIMKRFPCRKIVLDGSNYPRTIARLEEEIAGLDPEFGVESYVLKDNFAYVWVLDDEDG